jgi:hypothetical protein
MQQANDFNDPVLPPAIVDHMHGPPNALDGRFASRMVHVKASNTRSDVVPVPRERSLRMRGKLLDRVEQERLISEPRISAPSLGADGENAREIGFRRSGQPKSRHGR